MYICLKSIDFMMWLCIFKEHVFPQKRGFSEPLSVLYSALVVLLQFPVMGFIASQDWRIVTVLLEDLNRSYGCHLSDGVVTDG